MPKLKNAKAILVVDIGNSQIKVGLIKDQKLITFLKTDTSLDLGRGLFKEQLIKKFKNINIEGSIIGSVVPEKTLFFNNFIKDHFGISPYLISSKTKLNFCILKNVAVNEIGNDLLALACYCANLKAKDVIGFSFGTASVGIYLKNKELIGAIIAPGIHSSINCLIQKAHLLKKIKFNLFSNLPIGYDSKTAIESGLFHMRLGLISSFSQFIKKNYSIRQPKLIVTGGNATDFQMKMIQYDGSAILFGYKIIYDLNH